MVGFITESPIEDPDQELKLKDLRDQFEHSDTKANDFTFADSFLDFDAIENWFEDKTITDMADGVKNDSGAAENTIQMVRDWLQITDMSDGVKSNSGVAENTIPMVEDDSKTKTRILDQPIPNGSEPSVCGSTCMVKEECGKMVSSSSSIVEGVGNICLAGDSSSSVLGLSVKNEILSDGDKDEVEDEDESESSESESVSTSSSSSSTSSSSGSDSDNDDDKDNEEEKEEEDEEEQGERKEEIDVEVEEGEIRDSKGQVIGNTDDDDDEEEVEMITWGGVDDVGDYEDEDAGGDIVTEPIRSKNELEVLPSVPPVDVTLQPNHQMLPVGVVLSVVGAQVIVEGVEKHNPLNEGSILWITESRSPLGLVDEIFGPVKNPYYIVRYNSETEVPAGVCGGTLISFVPEFAHHVLNAKDLYKKGYDASGENDEELSDDAEFSDDEREAEYRRMKKLTKRGLNDQKPGKRKNDRKKVKNRSGTWGNDHSFQQKESVAPPNTSQHPTTPAASMLDSVSCSSAMGQGLPGGISMIPQSNGVWRNGLPLQRPQGVPFQQPQTVQFQQPQNFPFQQPQGMPFQQPQNFPFQQLQGLAFQNVFPTNGVSWLPQNIHPPYQMPVPGIPGHFDPNHGSLPTNLLAGQQHNIFAGAMHAQGFVGQNQMTFGMGLQFPPSCAPIRGVEQGNLSNGLQRNYNVHSNTIAGQGHPPHQFRPGPSSSRGKKAFHRGGARFAGRRGQ
ncbi:H/ACA ribonucleoprotein complex non-core subunit NAF1 [Quillaja saponaria]|uniref:H/ACA ribonucleoprotein complex non-core subunit NAF1 n=1 Tax=Quillaja saponaria TaxID=32244 RepID=A0AAD7PAN3_QUISA|nr:H/ACA ribonucleoprotein complex non-core subunit NAF1 [Quillaja saponaria]